MKYGFVIDNRKCIGCHACTTACKSEHDVPVGVNRTWVKNVEKGEFPDTRRLFSVMRCNHCTDAPCVEICPTEALFIREDGIVDFDKERCIGCKSCMQACPYDALYIDPETNTAAKCNYCAHRIDIGLEPACVNVCPEHAIISGDMEDADSEIAQLLSRQAVKVRKPEKGTQPNLFYIDADDVSLIPSKTVKGEDYFWSSQQLGVGHFAKEAEKMAFSNDDVLAEVIKIQDQEERANARVPKAVEVLMDQTKRTYDAPDKGILWGWEVSAYVWTKAISAGMILVPVLAYIFGMNDIPNFLWSAGAIVAMIFLILTGIFLVMDLDQPKRFAYVLLRPHWGSWLVKGGYAITVYGGLLALMLFVQYFNFEKMQIPIYLIAGITALIVAVYTAFLFAQAKGRDFWQSPTLSVHMAVHSIMAGLAIYYLMTLLSESSSGWTAYIVVAGVVAIVTNLATIFVELYTTHATENAKTVSSMITKGRYRSHFWLGVIIVGNLLPLAILSFATFTPVMGAIAGASLLLGIYINNHVWVEAPQRIALS